MLNLLKKIKFKLTHDCGGGVFVKYVYSPDFSKTLEVRYCKKCGNFITILLEKGKDYWKEGVNDYD